MSDQSDFTGNVIGIIASAFILVVLIYFSIAFIFALPIVAVWFFYKWKNNSPSALEKKSQIHTQELYLEVKARLGQPLSAEDFADMVLKKVGLDLPDGLADELFQVSMVLYDWEELEGDIPPPPAVCNSIEGARYRDFLSAQSAKSDQGVISDVAVSTMAIGFRGFLSNVPDLDNTRSNVYTCKLSDNANDSLDTMVSTLLHPYFLDDPTRFGLFKRFRDIVSKNVHEVSGIPYLPQYFDDPKLIYPVNYEGENVVFEYLKNTPFLSLFDIQIPVDISEETRFEHSWCIAPPGTGKTQLIQYLVSKDLEKVQKGEASVVVMDSAGDLIKNISRLKVFAPGQPLHGKLIVIKPDLKRPPALNLFDMGRDRFETYDDSTREKLTNGVIDQLTYVLDAMLGETGALTSRQETLFRYVIRLLMTLPESNLDVFGEVLKVNEKDFASYKQYVQQLSKPAQDFFNHQFFGKEFRGTKEQVGARLAGLRENEFFERMFSYPKSKLDLFTELNESKVILIHTDVQNLKERGTNVFGRYFIGALLSASQERASSKRLPVFTYIDECQDYIANDTKIATLLDQARKMRIGMFLAHQRTAQIKDRNVLDALSNSAIKFASTDNANDLPFLSKAMRTSSDFIATQPKQCFVVSARRASTFSFKVPFLTLEKMDQMEPEERKIVNAELKDKYYSPYVQYEKEAPPLYAVAEEDLDNPEI